MSQRYKKSDGTWNIEWKAKLKHVMGNDMTVTSVVQLWHNVVTHLEQTTMTDVTNTSHAWKSAKDNDATISLKTNWKPTFQWEQDDLILKAVPEKDVYALDAFYRVQPLSTFAIQLEFAKQFGLIQKDKNNKYHLGPNLEYELPQVTY